MAIMNKAFCILLLTLLLGCTNGGEKGTIAETTSATVETGKCSDQKQECIISARQIPIKNSIIYVLVDFEALGEYESFYKEAINDAFDYWKKENSITFVLISENESYTREHITITWTKMGSSTWAGFAKNNMVVVAYGATTCEGKWQPLRPETVNGNLKHELGHILGYDHSTDPNDLMCGESPNCDLNIFTLVSNNETQIVLPGWTFFRSICTMKNTTLAHSFEMASDEPIDIYVVQSIDDYNKAVNDQSFTIYNGCTAKNSRSLSCIADVVPTAGLLYINKGTKPANIRYVIKYVDQIDYPPFKRELHEK